MLCKRLIASQVTTLTGQVVSGRWQVWSHENTERLGPCVPLTPRAMGSPLSLVSDPRKGGEHGGENSLLENVAIVWQTSFSCILQTSVFHGATGAPRETERAGPLSAPHRCDQYLRTGLLSGGSTGSGCTVLLRHQRKTERKGRGWVKILAVSSEPTLANQIQGPKVSSIFQ